MVSTDNNMTALVVTASAAVNRTLQVTINHYNSLTVSWALHQQYSTEHSNTFCFTTT